MAPMLYKNRVCLSATKFFLIVVVFTCLSGQVALGQDLNVATIGDSVGADGNNRIAARNTILEAGGEVDFFGNSASPTFPTFARSGTTIRQFHMGRPAASAPGFVDYQAGFSDVEFAAVVIFGGYNDVTQAEANSDQVQNGEDLEALINSINESWDVDTIFVVRLYDLDFDNDPLVATTWEDRQGNVDRLNSHIDQLATEIANVETIEVNDFLDPSHYRPDGLHLNVDGQTVAGQQIGQALLELQAVPEPTSFSFLSLIMAASYLRIRRRS